MYSEDSNEGYKGCGRGNKHLCVTLLFETGCNFVNRLLVIIISAGNGEQKVLKCINVCFYLLDQLFNSATTTICLIEICHVLIGVGDLALPDSVIVR